MGIEGHRLSYREWSQRAHAHEERVSYWLEDEVRRRSQQRKHPVNDFLFEYYSFSPSKLRWWSPGAGIVLEGAGEQRCRFGFERVGSGVWLNPGGLPARLARYLRWGEDLLRGTAERPPRFGCFGLHEWAMVYREPDVRHRGVPLRLSDDDISSFVESQHLACSHFDAFRFFSKGAQLLNELQPTRASQVNLDQRGCLHVNMDLYKLAYKIFPWVPSEILADAFFLAREARLLDMRASPYDLSAWGLSPVAIETPEGRAVYVDEQRRISHIGEPIREALLAIYQEMQTAVSSKREAGSLIV